MRVSLDCGRVRDHFTDRSCTAGCD
jgi:hypothetical protein